MLVWQSQPPTGVHKLVPVCRAFKLKQQLLEQKRRLLLKAPQESPVRQILLQQVLAVTRLIRFL